MKKSKQNVSHYTFNVNCEGWRLHDTDSLSVIEERIPPGASEQLHYHKNVQQVFYILSGEAALEIDGITHKVYANESIHIPAKKLHRISNEGNKPLQFLLISEPKVGDDRIEMVEYSDGWNEPIKRLNEEWLSKYFRIEDGDVIALSNPKGEIIDKGGFIYYAKWKNEIVGTASLLKVTDDFFELGKMAVTETAQGQYIGNALLEHCFNEAKKKEIKRLVLYSNRSLGAAIHLYNKYGFIEIDMESGHYERANIKMEKIF